MKVQEYYLFMSEDNQQHAKPAQFVYESNDSDELTEFISEVNHEINLMKITLFSPIDIRPMMLAGAASLTMEELSNRLATALQANPEMMDVWDELIASFGDMGDSDES